MVYFCSLSKLRTICHVLTWKSTLAAAYANHLGPWSHRSRFGWWESMIATKVSVPALSGIVLYISCIDLFLLYYLTKNSKPFRDLHKLCKFNTWRFSNLAKNNLSCAINVQPKEWIITYIIAKIVSKFEQR